MLLNIRCKVRSVDYDSTLHSLFPLILKKCRAESEKHLIFQLLARLDNDGEQILAQLLSLMDEDEKQYLLFRFMGAFSPMLTELLNQKLGENHFGNAFSIGALVPALEDDTFVLYAKNTVVDETAFMEQLREHAPAGILGQAFLCLISPAVKKGDLTQTMTRLSANPIVQTTIRRALSPALRKQGICAELDCISIQPADNDAPPTAPAAPLLDQRAESILANALAAYLRHTANGLRQDLGTLSQTLPGA